MTDGLRRMAISQLDLAIELLGGDNGVVPAATAVHETRKALKRLRALIALLRDELGEGEFAREDDVLRGAGLRLAGARDAEVLVSTLDDLVSEHPKRLAHRRGVERLRRQLVAERDVEIERTREDAWARAQVVGELRAQRARVQAWTLPEREGLDSVEAGLRRIYRQGRRRRRRAARAKGEAGRAMHRWRKRVKDLRYAAAMLDRRDPGRPSAHKKGARRRAGHGRAQRPDAGYMRRLARRADELGELLGEEHDLALLAARLKAGAERSGGRPLQVGGATQEDPAEDDRQTAQAPAQRGAARGQAPVRATPGSFVRRMGVAYARARPQQPRTYP